MKQYQKGNVEAAFLLAIGMVALGLFTFMGNQAGVASAYNRCIKHYETMSVVEANKLCKAIVYGETK